MKGKDRRKITNVWGKLCKYTWKTNLNHWYYINSRYAGYYWKQNRIQKRGKYVALAVANEGKGLYNLKMLPYLPKCVTILFDIKKTSLYDSHCYSRN